MYGADLAEAAFVDMVLLGVEDIRKAYISLIYQVWQLILRVVHTTQ
jgi:hypothetical protein